MARKNTTTPAGIYAISLTKYAGLQGWTAIYWNGETLETRNVVTAWYCKVDATHWMSGGYDNVAPYCCDCTEAANAVADAAADDAITDMLAYPTLKDWVNDAPAPMVGTALPFEPSLVVPGTAACDLSLDCGHAAHDGDYVAVVHYGTTWIRSCAACLPGFIAPKGAY